MANPSLVTTFYRNQRIVDNSEYLNYSGTRSSRFWLIDTSIRPRPKGEKYCAG